MPLSILIFQGILLYSHSFEEMVSWYIKSRGFKSEQYLRKVEETIGPLMEYFIDRISEIEEWDIDKIVPGTLLSDTKVEELYKEIFDELPVMRLRTNKGEIWLEYNKDTDIIFVDPKKSIKREMLLNNLLK